MEDTIRIVIDTLKPIYPQAEAIMAPHGAIYIRIIDPKVRNRDRDAIRDKFNKTINLLPKEIEQKIGLYIIAAPKQLNKLGLNIIFEEAKRWYDSQNHKI